MYTRLTVEYTDTTTLLSTLNAMGFERENSSSDNFYYADDTDFRGWWLEFTGFTSGTVTAIKSYRTGNSNENPHTWVTPSSTNKYIQIYYCLLDDGVCFGFAAGSTTTFSYTYMYTQMAVVHDSAVNGYVYIRKWDLSGTAYISSKVGDSSQVLANVTSWIHDGYFSLVKLPHGSVICNDIYITACSPTLSADDYPTQVDLTSGSYFLAGSAMCWGKSRVKFAFKLPASNS